jgi:hypothetical protein
MAYTPKASRVALRLEPGPYGHAKYLEVMEDYEIARFCTETGLYRLPQ